MFGNQVGSSAIRSALGMLVWPLAHADTLEGICGVITVGLDTVCCMLAAS